MSPDKTNYARISPLCELAWRETEQNCGLAAAFNPVLARDDYHIQVLRGQPQFATYEFTDGRGWMHYSLTDEGRKLVEGINEFYTAFEKQPAKK